MALKSSLSWMGLCQVLTVALQFAASVVLARFLSPQEMGIYAVAGAAVGLLAMMQAFGLQSLIVREEALTEEVSRTAFTTNAALAILLALSIAAMSVLGGKALGDNRVRQVMLALSLTPLTGIFDFLPGAYLERTGRFKIMALAGIASGLVAAAATIAGAVLGARYMTAAYAGWASALTNAIFVNIAGRRHASLRVGFSQWRRIASFGLQMMATSGLHSIGGRLSDLCLGKLQGLSALGIYGRASSLNGLIWNNIHMVVGRVMFVDFAQLHRQGVNLRERYIATVDVITAVLWPAFAGAAVLAGPMILTIYGERWVSAALPMAFMALSSIVLVAITMTWEIFTATGNLSIQTRIEFYNAIFTTAAFAVGSYFGLAVAAASRVVSAVVAIFLYRPHLNRMTDTSTKDFLPIYARSTALTVIAIAPAVVLMACYRFSPHAPILLVLGSAALGALLWASALVLFKHPLVEQGRSIIAQRLGKIDPIPEAIIASVRPYEVVD